MIIDKDDKRKSSRSYGESLLADVRERSDEYQKTYERKARQAEWRGMAFKAATGIAKDYMEQRAQNFVDQEAATLRKLGANTVLENNQKTLDNMKAAKDHLGGEDSYYQSKLAEKYEALLVSKYAGTSYSATKVSAMANLLAKKSYDKYKGFVDKDIDLTQKFVSDNIDSETYVRNATNLSKDEASFLRNLPGIKQLTGKINEDMISANDLYRTNLTALKAARAESLRQKDGLILNATAEFLEKHDDLQKLFGTRDTITKVISFTTMDKYDDYGNIIGKKNVANVVKETPDGNVVNAFAAEVDGEGMLSRIPTSSTENKSFTRNIASISQRPEMMAEATAWRSDTGNVSPEDLKILTTHRTNLLDDTNIGSQGDKAVANYLQNLETSDTAFLFLGGKKSKDDKFGTLNVGYSIAHEMQLMRAEGNPNVVGKGIGSENIFNTLFAYKNALDKGRVPKSSLFVFNKFLENNVDSMKKQYLNMSNSERAELFKKITGDKDDGGYGSFTETFKTFMPLYTEVADAVQNKQGVLDEAKLTAILYGLSVETDDTDSGDDGAPVVTPDATAAPVGAANLSILKTPSTAKITRQQGKTKEGQKSKRQAREYKLLGKYAERVAFLEKNIDAPVQYGIDNAKKLVSAKKMLDSSYNAYAEKYGYTLGTAELADLTDEEKEKYFSTGIRPDRHTPAA